MAEIAAEKKAQIKAEKELIKALKPVITVAKSAIY
jgi:hypothetical protein